MLQFECQNCSGLFSADQLNEIKDFQLRHEPGDIVADGECPDCGALCFCVGDDEKV